MKVENEYGYCEYEFKDDYVHIFNLYIYPKYRRQGRARSLLACIITDIRERMWTGEIQIVCNPREDSILFEDLKAFYEEMGLTVYTYYG